MNTTTTNQNAEENGYQTIERLHILRHLSEDMGRIRAFLASTHDKVVPGEMDRLIDRIMDGDDDPETRERIQWLIGPVYLDITEPTDPARFLTDVLEYGYDATEMAYDMAWFATPGAMCGTLH